MGSPEQSLLAQFEARRFKDNLFQSPRDYEAQGKWTQEQVEKLGAAVHLFLSSTERAPADGPGESAGVDPLYGDILDPEFIDDEGEYDKRKFNLRCIVEHSPSKQLLLRYGIEEERDVIFHFPYQKLVDEGIVTTRRFRGVDIGDLIEWDGTWYIVLSTHREAYFGQTVSNYFTSTSCKRYRANSVPTGATHEEHC